MDKTNFLEFARGRYSCRKLTGAPVAAEKLKRVLEAARIAPITHNEQPFRVFLLESPKVVERVHETTPCIFGVGCFLMVAAVPGEAWVRESDQANFATVDTSTMVTHIMFTIETEGLSTIQIGYFDAPHARELFPVMAPYELIAPFPIGEKAAEAHPAHLHEKRKPIANLMERF